MSTTGEVLAAALTRPSHGIHAPNRSLTVSPAAGQHDCATAPNAQIWTAVLVIGTE